jgi:hypothetical protein
MPKKMSEQERKIRDRLLRGKSMNERLELLGEQLIEAAKKHLANNPDEELRQLVEEMEEHQP